MSEHDKSELDLLKVMQDVEAALEKAGVPVDAPLSGKLTAAVEAKNAPKRQQEEPIPAPWSPEAASPEQQAAESASQKAAKIQASFGEAEQRVGQETTEQQPQPVARTDYSGKPQTPQEQVFTQERERERERASTQEWAPPHLLESPIPDESAYEFAPRPYPQRPAGMSIPKEAQTAWTMVEPFAAAQEQSEMWQQEEEDDPPEEQAYDPLEEQALDSPEEQAFDSLEAQAFAQPEENETQLINDPPYAEPMVLKPSRVLRDTEIVRDQIKEIREKRARRQQRTRVVAVVLLVMCLLVVGGVLAFTYLLPELKKSAASTLPESVMIMKPAPPTSVVRPPPVSSTAQAVLPESAVSAPEPISVAPMEFTEKETQQLDMMLDAWAATDVPLPTPKEDSSGEQSVSSVAASVPKDPNYGHNVAVYFQDIDSGATYLYNGETKFFVASISKAPYAMYMYELVSAGQANLADIITITPEDIVGSEENSGVIKDDPDLPKDFTLEELLECLLRKSDTVAQRMLLKKFPAEPYAKWAAELGLQYPQDVRGVTSGRITALDAGVYSKAIYTYMQTGEYGAQLKENLLNANNPMIRSQSPVAHKYGWDKAAYHDMAVVYTEHPYVLTILTDKSADSVHYPDLTMFKTIAETFEGMMNAKYAEAA